MGLLRSTRRAHLLCALALAAWGPSQVVWAERLLPRHLVLFEAPINRDEVFIGGSYRFLPSRSVPIGPFLAFEGRAKREVVLEPIRPRFFLQREEARYYGTLGVEGSHYLGTHTGAFAAAAAAYSFGSYGGTHAKPEMGWTPVLRAGILGRVGSERRLLHLRVGYEYSDLRTKRSNRVFLAAGGEFQ